MIYSRKNIGVLGLGVSGLSIARLLKSSGAHVTLFDSVLQEISPELLKTLNHEEIPFHIAVKTISDISQYHFFVVSPGISLKEPLITAITKFNIPIYSEIEIATSLCSIPIVAITGTNGKTTTTEITTQILNESGLKAVAAGNIGIPFSQILLEKKSWDFIVLEVSSFQLESISSVFCPCIAVWLNFSPNHLDRHESVDEYRKIKLKIFENQRSNHWAIVPYEDNFFNIQSQKKTISLTNSQADIWLDRNKQIHLDGYPSIDFSTFKMKGEHNAYNLMAGLIVGSLLNAEILRSMESIKQYNPPPHRLEFVARCAGLNWINDSKSTTLDSLEKAILSISGSVVLIAGGKNKGFNFSSITPLIQQRVRHAILIGEMRHSIAKDWSCILVTLADSLSDAVKLAVTIIEKDSTILFSPGTSSLDMFENYEKRGEEFCKLVRSLED